MIVIGSGMSGLAAASVVAQFRKMRILVLEAHFTLFGYLHSFESKGYEWDPGFHYVGDMAKGTQTRDCVELVTGGQVEWEKLDEHFEQLIFPDASFEVPASTEAQKELLKKKRSPMRPRGSTSISKTSAKCGTGRRPGSTRSSGPGGLGDR